MGMDVYGLNPELKSEKPEIDWNDSTEEQRDQYFEAINVFESENPGYYFRNNVWFWRPLWDFVCNTCDDFLTDKDIKTHIYQTAKNTIELGNGIKLYNKKYYSGNLTGEKAAVTEVKEEVLVSSVTTEPKVEKIEKKQTMAFTLCYLSFFLALAIGSFVFISVYGFVSLSKTKRTRKVKKKIKIKRKGRRK